MMLFSATGSSFDNAIQFTGGGTNDVLRVQFDGNNAGFVPTAGVYRDPSSWYHIVVAVDTTQATAANRVRIYVNGVEVTYGTTTYPTQNYSTMFNSTNAHNIGRSATGSNQYFDGYMADINFIDGQALTPSSFGQTNPVTGVWQPKAYSGTYGTNGFKLNFSDGTSTTTLGYDSSGNSNNWTTNNISLTAGSTYDWMLDSPTPFAGSSYGVGNYAVLNPLGKSTYANISNGNLNISWSDNASANFAANSATITLPSSGKWYFELSNAAADGNNGIGVGICDATKIANGGNTTPTTYYLYRSDANNTNIGYQSNAGSGSTGSTFLGGAICGIAVDLDNGKFWAAINNTWQGGGNPATGTSPGYSGISNATTWVPFIGGWEWTGTVCSASINFGQRPFSYTPPSGFKSLCTQNLPAPTIVKGSAHMNAVLDTGANIKTTSQALYTYYLEWIKDRANANNHQLADTVRGNTAILQTNTTAAETTYTAPSGNSVGWVWNANTAAVSNTSGTITSQVSANTTAGFSVVTYTAGATNATVGHGLGIAPNLIITKSRSNAVVWPVYHSSLGKDAYLILSATDAVNSTITNYWGTSAPSSTVFGLANAGYGNNSGNMVAYCFAAIAGYSAFGSFSGNASTDGVFVYTGFLPRLVMVKCSSTTGNWYIFDSARNTYNVLGEQLYPNLSNAGSTATTLDFLSNGFKMRTASDPNASATYIYAAFASSPFQNSLAF
jgi:hypothetical protein